MGLQIDERWKFAIQLCAVYGLRPEEPRYLRTKDGVEGKELWIICQKSKDGISVEKYTYKETSKKDRLLRKWK